MRTDKLLESLIEEVKKLRESVEARPIGPTYVPQYVPMPQYVPHFPQIQSVPTNAPIYPFVTWCMKNNP